MSVVKAFARYVYQARTGGGNTCKRFKYTGCVIRGVASLIVSITGLGDDMG